ncbi:VMAP-C domain-containing protein [Streptomyces sp. SD31]|uniref:VMAP-C domain-containing protein n=1 Tax=Streptomyces sp. SD31 TaxID=3452208 RepID=UPI003F8BABB1
MSELEDLTRGATVRLGPAGDPDVLWGSGFFVAPGWVLSCAHVLRLGEDGERKGLLRVSGEHGAARARPAYWLGSRVDPEQDLVLLRLLDDVPHACVRLTDRYDRPHEITAFGWRARSGGPETWSGRCLVSGTDGDYGVTLGPESEIPHGASGGPVLDRLHGVVAGVVKARRRGRDGGLAVAATALRGFGEAIALDGGDELGPDPYHALIRAHDQWHHNRHRDHATRRTCWVAAQERLAAPHARVWRPSDGATACALLADLPLPEGTDTLQRLIKVVLDVEPHWRGAPPPRDWRDGHGWLYDRSERADIAFLHYLTLVAQGCAQDCPAPVAALEDWLRERVETLPDGERGLLKDKLSGGRTPKRAAAPPPRSQGDDGRNPVVTVVLEPDAFHPADRFHWRVWIWPGGSGTTSSLAESDGMEGVPLTALQNELREPLGKAFQLLDSPHRRARLEVALPVEHFDVDVDFWRPQAAVRSYRLHPAERPFGVHRQVVLRYLGHSRGLSAQAWRERWRALDEGGLEALPLNPPAYARTTLESAPGPAVPVLCRTAAESLEALEEAIDAGYGLALWARGVQHTYGCGQQCVDLHEHTAKLLRRTGRAVALPEALRRLRERIGECDEEAEWAEPLALLYDDPQRPVPRCDEPLNSP